MSVGLGDAPEVQAWRVDGSPFHHPLTVPFSQPGGHRRIRPDLEVAFDIGVPHRSVFVGIYDPRGARIRNAMHRPVPADAVAEPGRFTFTWDGRNGLGERAATSVEYHFVASVGVDIVYLNRESIRPLPDRDRGGVDAHGFREIGREDVFTMFVPRPDAAPPGDPAASGLLRIAALIVGAAAVVVAT